MVVMTPQLLTAVAPLFNVGGALLSRAGKHDAGKALSIMGSVFSMAQPIASSGAFGGAPKTGTPVDGVDTPFNPTIPKKGEGGLKIIEGKPDLNKPKWLPQGKISQADARKSLIQAVNDQSKFISQNQGPGALIWDNQASQTPLRIMGQLDTGVVDPTDVSHLFPQ